jgi:hypothetical protein
MKIFDFTVHRLSGGRVYISWRVEDESPQIIYEVMRMPKKMSWFVSLGIVQPSHQENNSSDYSFIDLNNFSDSSYYRLKKTNTDSVIFYSMTKGVAGIAKNR